MYSCDSVSCGMQFHVRIPWGLFGRNQPKASLAFPAKTVPCIHPLPVKCLFSGSGARWLQTPAPPLFSREAPPPSWDGSEPGLMLCRLRRTFACGSLRQEWTGRNVVCLTGSARAAADSLEFEQLTSGRCAQNTLNRFRDHFSPPLES